MLVEKYRIISVLIFAAVWVQMCIGFISDEIIPVGGVVSIAFLFADVVFLVAGLLMMRTRRDFFFLLTFVGIAAVSTIVNDQSLADVLNGSREFFGLLFVIPVIRFMLLSKDGARLSLIHI